MVPEVPGTPGMGVFHMPVGPGRPGAVGVPGNGEGKTCDGVVGVGIVGVGVVGMRWVGTGTGDAGGGFGVRSMRSRVPCPFVLWTKNKSTPTKHKGNDQRRTSRIAASN